MGHFLDVAYQVLAQAEKPLSAAELVAIGKEKGYLRTNGETPAQTMKSKLSTDILKNKDRSSFMRTSEGLFGLRHWKDTLHKEYVADRFVKGLLQEDIVVFPADILRNYVPYPGLHAVTLVSSEALIAECRIMERELAEVDCSVIQLISVFILQYNNQYLTYKRTKRLPEKRLHHCYSMVFGGHINPPELGLDGPVGSLFNVFRPDHGEWLLARELHEEVRFDPGSSPEIRYKGLLYDDSVAVSKQHLGIVYDVFLKDQNFQIGERGFLMDAKFETLEEIEERASEFENWSLLVVQFEKDQRNNNIQPRTEG